MTEERKAEARVQKYEMNFLVHLFRNALHEFRSEIRKENRIETQEKEFILSTDSELEAELASQFIRDEKIETHNPALLGKLMIKLLKRYKEVKYKHVEEQMMAQISSTDHSNDMNK